MFVRFFEYVLIVLLSMIRSNIANLYCYLIKLILSAKETERFCETPRFAIASLLIKLQSYSTHCAVSSCASQRDQDLLTTSRRFLVQVLR